MYHNSLHGWPLYLKKPYYRFHALRSLSSRNYQSLPGMEAETPVSSWITCSFTLSSTSIFPPTCVCGCLRYHKEYLKIEIYPSPLYVHVLLFTSYSYLQLIVSLRKSAGSFSDVASCHLVYDILLACQAMKREEEGGNKINVDIAHFIVQYS